MESTVSAKRTCREQRLSAGSRMITRIRLVRPGIAAAMIAVCVIAVACGGGGGSSKKDEGAAAVAVAQFFHQEAAGDRLPDGVNVIPGGADTIKALAVSGDQKKESVSSRVCVTYIFTALDAKPPAVHKRVYIASLIKGAWSVEFVKPDGTCDDVG